LVSNVGQNNFALNNSELPFIDRNNRTVTAKVLTSTAGFGVSDEPTLSVSKFQMSILSQSRQPRSLRGQELLFTQGSQSCDTRSFLSGCTSDQSFGQLNHLLFKFSSQDRLHTHLPQIGGIQRSIEAITTEMSYGI